MRRHLSVCLLALLCAPALAADSIELWNAPQHGANSFNGAPPDEAYFRALRGYGATWVRLTFSKWKSSERDFLFGSLDEYRALDTSSPNLKRAVPYRYPGVTPFGGGDLEWNAARVTAYLQQPVEWAKAHGVPVNRLVAGEFGCVRTWVDCPRYLEDVLTALDADGVHWAFYSFREDVWDAMDYELGAGKLPWQYWEAQEKGTPFVLPRGPNPVFSPILRRLGKPPR